MTVEIIDPYDKSKVHYYWIKSHRWDNGTYKETYKTAIQNALASAYALQELGGTEDEDWVRLRDRTMYEFIYMSRYSKITAIPAPSYVYVPDEEFFRMVDLKMQIRMEVTKDYMEEEMRLFDEHGQE